MGRAFSKRRGAAWRAAWLLTGMAALAACDDAQMPGFLKPKDGASESGETVSRAAQSVERDIEAPEVFHATEAGLWDGRPSLGGVWVAHPEVTEPERVIIRNQQNGQFVIGALFRRERQSPGPRLQVSSDAAAALGMLAGAPTNLDVIALRREEAPAEEVPTTEAASDETTAIAAAPDVSEGTLDPVAASAAAALDSAAGIPARGEQVAAATTAAPAASPAPKPKPAAKPASSLDKPYLQIGIFSVEQNAENTATAMRQQGMVPTVRKQESSGKTFWRVIVGPAQTSAERAELLKKIKASGFTDAYAVTN
ncbi:SPOR domain-containing protein [Salipiger bermudensis]|uniref:SPOR domain-containing protein n=1 Tax=Salipiger bermudensis TaxID=344736 RepID=UPI001C98EA64|nr:SPOR domain-containing protein [Salipiger bermudensis]MBY6002356.1 SPOR domain-containing protein [Salipiger bermudensis]